MSEKIFYQFFGPKWSLMFSAPLLMIGGASLFFLKRKLGEIWLPLVLFLISLLFLVLLTVDSSSYGNRYLIPATSVFAFGLAGLVEWSKKNHFILGFTMTIIVLCLFAQYLMVVQYRIFIPFNHPSFSWEALTQWPKQLINFEYFLLRSTNFFKLMIIKSGDWNYLDWSFLFLFPFFQLFFLIAIVLGVFKIKKENHAPLNLTSQHAVFLFFGLTVLISVVVFNAAPSKGFESVQARGKYSRLYKMAHSADQERDFDQAIKLYKEASILIPEHWLPYYRLALDYDLKKDLVEANKYYQKALFYNPDHFLSSFNLGRNYISLGNYEKAALFLKQASRIKPHDERVYQILAQIYSNQEQFAPAEKMFRLSISLNPNYKNAHLNYALFLAGQARHQEAIFHLQKAISLGVNHPKAKILAKVYNLQP